MSILTFVLLLAIIAVVIYGIKLAFAGAWKELVFLVIGLIAAIWILSALGITLPTLPRIQ